MFSEISSRSISVSWTSDNLQPISGYSVQFKQKLGVWNDIDRKLSEDDNHSIQINNLQPANEYNLRVFAKNLMGESASSEIISFKTDAEIPSGPPEAVILKATNAKELLLSWSPPAKEYWNGEILGYSIGVKKTNENDDHFKFIKTGRSNNEYRLKDLEEWTSYDVILKCFNEKGEGTPSSVVSGMRNVIM